MDFFFSYSGFRVVSLSTTPLFPFSFLISFHLSSFLGSEGLPYPSPNFPQFLAHIQAFHCTLLFLLGFWVVSLSTTHLSPSFISLTNPFSWLGSGGTSLSIPHPSPFQFIGLTHSCPSLWVCSYILPRHIHIHPSR